MIEKSIEALDIAYISSFSTQVKTNWGYFFFNLNQPDYYDANHAHISQYPSNLDQMIEEIVAFYETKQLIPRIYLANYDKQDILLDKLKERGFGFEEFFTPVQIWKTNVQTVIDPDVTIERVTDNNKKDAINIECQIKELGGAIREKAFEEEFALPTYYNHYLLSYKGIPCSTACIFRNNKDARLESVATLEEYRGMGLIGQLIHFIQQQTERSGIDRLWVIPIDERVANVYKKSGFETVATLKTGHAFLGGKSVTEIRNFHNIG